MSGVAARARHVQDRVHHLAHRRRSGASQAFLRRQQRADYPTAPFVSYQINRQLSGWNLPPLVFRAFARPCSGFTSSASSSTIGKSASPAPKRLSPRSLRRTRRQSLDRCPVLTGSGGRNRIRTYDLLIKRGLVQLQMGAIKLQVTLVAGPKFEPTSAPARSMILVVCGPAIKPKSVESTVGGCRPPQPFTRGSERKPKPEYEMVGIVPGI